MKCARKMPGCSMCAFNPLDKLLCQSCDHNRDPVKDKTTGAVTGCGPVVKSCEKEKVNMLR